LEAHLVSPEGPAGPEGVVCEKPEQAAEPADSTAEEKNEKE
jgi:hypothetical protein